MACSPTSQWFSAETNGFTIAAATSAWLYEPSVSPMSWRSAHTLYSSSAPAPWAMLALWGARQPHLPLALPGPVAPGRGLQAVRDPIDGEAAVVAREQLQMADNA